MTKKEAIKIILADKENYKGTLNYAINYCRAALHMDEDSDAFRVQVLYILNNIPYWRHPKAKEVREVLKKKNLKKKGRI